MVYSLAHLLLATLFCAAVSARSIGVFTTICSALGTRLEILIVPGTVCIGLDTGRSLLIHGLVLRHECDGIKCHGGWKCEDGCRMKQKSESILYHTVGHH
ncbi:hypothetical protein EV363DRAFT_1358479 [Boletus edulis]|nr:hypothetical protein EV363DRAFT_1358479 [Boletus edulis]